jgi:carboxymethylenebutenolidase
MMQEFTAGEQSFPGYLALPPGGSGPGVLVLHAWWGLNATFREVCDRLAADGFVALAPDLYHGAIAQTIAEAERLRDAADQAEATLRQEIGAAVDVLRDHPAVRGAGLGVVGFSMGGYWALELAQERPADIAAVVLFYGSGPASDARARAAFLGHFAADDAYEPPKMVAELAPALQAAGHAVTFHTYPGTRHWFFEADRPDAYNAEAAALAWERTRAFLHTQLD